MSALRPRKETTDVRLDAAVKGLAESGKLAATVKIPDAAGPLRVEADLRTRRLSTTVTVESPREGNR